MPRDVGAIVVAAGQGVRFDSATPKQFHVVGGVPIVLRAVRSFTSHPDVGEVVLVLAPEYVREPPAFLSGVFDPSVLTIVAGGTHRGDSVRAGLAALRPECTVVLVHDGARPFVDRGVVDLVIGHARRGDGAVPAVLLSDTLKEVAPDDSTRIARTRPRAHLWRAQTPQGFPRAVLEEAYERAGRTGYRATDDAALVESMGVTVRLVPDSSRNIKVTTPEDLALAELLSGASR